MIIEESQWGHRQWQLMRVRLLRGVCLVIITEPCEACSVRQLDNVKFVQLVIITEPCEACSVQQLNSVKFAWPMWSSFNCSIIGQFGVDSVPNICTTFFYIHCTDMNTDADEVKHRTDDVGDEDHQHQWCNGNDEGNWFGVRYLQVIFTQPCHFQEVFGRYLWNGPSTLKIEKSHF